MCLKLTTRRCYGDPEDYFNKFTFRLDKDGIIENNYGIDLGFQKNPVTIAQFSIANFNKFKETNQLNYLEVFNRHINFLINNIEYKGKTMAAYSYDFPFPLYSLKKGWHSGLAQAEVSMALMRYCYLYKDEKIIELIDSIVQFMLLPIEKGGLKSISPEGGLWIEEYPSCPNSYVLNGFLTIIICLFEYVNNINRNAEIVKLYNDCLSSLKVSVNYYIEKDWLLYHRYKNRVYCSIHYMEMQIEQFEVLFSITDDPFFNNIKQKLLNFLSDMKIRVRTRKEKIIDSIFKISESKRIGIYGAGEHTRKLFELTSLKNKNIVVLIDKDPNVFSNDNKIIQPNEINNLQLDLIIISSLTGQEEIFNSLVTEIKYSGEILKFYNQNDILPFYS